MIKNFRPDQLLHCAVMIACCGHSAEFGHTVNYSHLAGVGGLQNWTSMTDGHGPWITWRQWLGLEESPSASTCGQRPRHFVLLDFTALLWLVQSYVKTLVFNITDRSSFSIFSILVDIVGQYRYSDCWTRDERDSIHSLYCAVTCWCVWWIFKVFLGVLHN